MGSNPTADKLIFFSRYFSQNTLGFNLFLVFFLINKLWTKIVLKLLIKQIKSWDYNYKAASSSLYGSDTLLRNPDQVAANDEMSWATAFWFWKINVISGPYGQGVKNGQFGSSTNAINGGLECRGANSDKARKRFEIYKKVLIAFNINTTPNETGCYN